MLNVNPTRMELLRLRRRVELASRGHKLLSEKRDEISRHLIRITREIRPLREQVEKELLETCRRFMLARAVSEPEDVTALIHLQAFEKLGDRPGRGRGQPFRVERAELIARTFEEFLFRIRSDLPGIDLLVVWKHGSIG